MVYVDASNRICRCLCIVDSCVYPSFSVFLVKSLYIRHIRIANDRYKFITLNFGVNNFKKNSDMDGAKKQVNNNQLNYFDYK